MTKDDRELQISEITTSHIRNTLNWLRKNDENGFLSELYEDQLKEELNKRRY